MSFTKQKQFMLFTKHAKIKKKLEIKRMKRRSTREKKRKKVREKNLISRSR